MTNDLARARSLSPEEKRALLESLLLKEPPGSRVAPLSFAQQGLWFLEALEDLGSTYHLPFRLSLKGALDAAALRRALDRIVDRHEILRTTFGQVDGKPVQRVAAALPGGFPLAEHDLRGVSQPRAALRELVVDEAGTRLDLERGPLVRGSLVRVADDEHVLLVTMHHIVSDGWSMGVFGRELSTLYGAFVRGEADPLSALPTQYADYAAWQRRRVGGELLERQASYWEQSLAGAPELLELPTDRPRPRVQDFAGASLPLELDATLTAALKGLSRRHGTTLFMTLLASWATVLGRLSGQADVVVGTPTAGRERRETEDLIGFFVHMLALRVDLSGTPSAAELLARVRARALQAQQHQDIPFEQVVDRVRPARSLAYSPLFQVVFAWQSAGGGDRLALPGLTAGEVEKPAQNTAKFDLTLALWESDGCITGSLEYATALFDPDTVARYAAYLEQVLREMAADESRPVGGLRLRPRAQGDYGLPDEPLRTTPLATRMVGDWWLDTGDSVPAPELPGRHARAAEVAAVATGTLQAEAWSELGERCAAEGLVPDGLLLGVFAEVLAAWSKSPAYAFAALLHDGCGAAPAALVSVPVDHVHDHPFRERAAQVAAAARGTDRPRLLGPFADVLRALRDPACPRAVAPVLFVIHPRGAAGSGAPAGTPACPPRNGAAPAGRLELHVWERDGALHHAWAANEARLPAGLLNDLSGAFAGLLQELAETPSAWASPSLSVLPRAQRELRARVNATGGPVSEALLHTLFTARAAEDPSRVAVLSSRRDLTYGELDDLSSRMATRLRGLGVRLGELVAVVMEKGWEQAAAVLAILKAGGAYLPMGPDLPASRLHELLEIGEVRCALTQGWVDDALAWPAELVRVRFDDPEVLAASAAGLEPVRAPDDLAYVIFTSGSTGRPKGVMISHRGAVNTLVNLNTRFGVGPLDRVLALSSLSFDLSVYDIFGALAAGAAVVFPDADRGRDPGHWIDTVERHGVTLWDSVPALMGLATEYLEQERRAFPASVRLVWMSGDWIPVTLPGRIRALGGGRASIISMGGATEASIWSILYPIEEVDPAWPSIPYGRPMVNQHFYVLDGALENRPLWVPGDLYIGGIGVAMGYLHDPVKTAEKFVTHPRTGERLYRTGDLGRYLPDGNIEFLGREDFQVKVRGHRIELGEIEGVMREHPAVLECVVAPVGDGLERQLVGYLVPAADAALEVQEIRTFLLSRLPEYMVPAALLRLDALPLTANGKVDRAALPAPEGDVYAARAYQAPAGPTEAALAALWEELLGVERVGRNDNFFELGGHSLLAMQLGSRVRQGLGVEIALREVFAAPALADLARAVQAAARTSLPAIVTVSREERLPLSFGQQRLWFLDQLGTLGSLYHIPGRRRLRGTLDRAALARALDRIVARHEVLRTRIVAPGGEPELRIAPADASRFALREHDLDGHADAEAALAALVADETHAPFDLENGPLIRGRLVRMAADDHVLLVTMHHVVSDGWSMAVLDGELAALYTAFCGGGGDPLPALPTQYADYAAWQRRWVRGEVLERQAAYWKQTLAGAPELLELPTDRARPRTQDFEGGLVPVALDADLSATLRALGRRRGTTLYMTLLAAWAAVLSRLSGQDDVVVGSPVAGRGREEIEGLIGLFVNTLALRVDLSGAPTVAELLQRVRDRALESQQHQDLPFEQVVELLEPVRSLSHSPLAQASFAWQNTPRAGTLALPGLRLEALDAAMSRVQSKTDLSLVLWEKGDRIVGAATYATALFDPATVERWVGYLRRALEQMAADDGQPVERLSLMPESERTLVLDAWNRTAAPYPAESCIHERFEAQVARTPDAVAVVFQGERVTYAELNGRANRLAHHLRDRGVGLHVRVGLCVRRSPEMVVGLLAVLKAGGVFVPLDPAYPRERLEYMLADSAPAAVLAEGAVMDRLAAALDAGGRDVPLLRLDAADPPWAGRPAANLDRGALTPAHPAYVTYTSGSTGWPKGVPAVHHRVLNLIHWYGREMGITERDAVLLVMSFSFDGTYRNLFAPLFAGGQLHLAGEPFDPAAIVAQIAADGISTVNLTPTAFQSLVEADRDGALAAMRTVVLVGEAVQPRTLLELPEPRPALVNLYGPTECSGIVTFHWLSRDLAGYLDRPVPAGRPISNGRVYVLDRSGSPVPTGVAGELHIGGTPVGPGYQNGPEQTADRFVADPFGGEPGARLYRTGDRARWRTDGTLEFLGRMDQQVKVRGYRIEPGEIEARLQEHASVREAVVLVREDTPGDRRLVAYVVGGGAAGADVLGAHVREAMPDYMVPAAYVRMESLPRTPNGKLDRRALPAPHDDAFAARAYEAPADETEQEVAGIWAEVLRVDRVGRWDNFFELGGHSLSAVQVVSRVRQALDVNIALAEIFARPVLAEFARQVLDAQLAQVDPDAMAELMALLRESPAG